LFKIQLPFFISIEVSLVLYSMLNSIGIINKNPDWRAFATRASYVV